MNDTTPAPVAPESSPEPAEEPAAGSHRVWALLLVLDSAFVIVFGGLVASKLYQYWNEPAAVPAHRRVARPAEPAKAPQPAAAAPVSQPSAAKPAPPPAEAPTPAPVATQPPPAPAASSDVKPVKARPVDFKLHARRASSVQIVGAFIVHGGRKDMTRRPDGTWSVRLYLKPGRYRYFFFVDGKRVLDPANPVSDRGASMLLLH
ncbi:MAG: hypothetical protein HKL90_16300 [Elusimicrobia bacterium]|nr:hypothetical protein [Elusimicrobiota bacterium]